MTEVPLWSADVSRHGSTSTVTLGGELDLMAAEPLRQLIIEELDRPGTTDVAVDLAAVTFLDSAGLGALILAYQHAEGTDRHLVMREPARPVRRVLEISGVYEMLVAPGDATAPRV